MAQPVGKRGMTQTEYYHTFQKINDEITVNLSRDFGMKRLSGDLKAFIHKVNFKDPRERAVFEYLCDKYGIEVEQEFPLYIIERYRNQMLDRLDSMELNITRANTIYPISEYEFKRRRDYQWKAQSDCYECLQIMQKVIRRLPVNVQKQMRYVGMLDKELRLLKDWRNSDSHRLEAILMKEEKEKYKVELKARADIDAQLKVFIDTIMTDNKGTEDENKKLLTGDV